MTARSRFSVIDILASILQRGRMFSRDQPTAAFQKTRKKTTKINYDLWEHMNWDIDLNSYPKSRPCNHTSLKPQLSGQQKKAGMGHEY